MTRFVVATVLALAASLFVVLLVGAASRPEPISGDDFARSVRNMASIAREVALFSNELAEQRITQSFAAIHREKLGDLLDDERDKLETTFPAPLADAGTRARGLGKDLAEQVQALKLAVADPSALKGVEASAQRIGTDLAALEPHS